MRKLEMRHLIFALAIFLFGFLSFSAYACPSGQYEQCVGPSIHNFGININPKCVCLPNSGSVVNSVSQAANPVPDVLTFAGATVNGNIKQAYSSLGAILVQSACMTCEAALNVYASKEDKAAIEGIVFQGWLTYITGDPTLLMVNADGTQSDAVPLTPPAPSPIPVKPPAPRGTKVYVVVGASCAIKTNDSATAGWVDPPSLTDSASGTVYKFPNVDLRPGDTISIASNDSCEVVPAGVSHVKSVKITYSYNNLVVSGAPTEMKWFFTGKVQD